MSNLVTKTINKRINDDGTITIQYKELNKEITYPKRNNCFDKIIASILNNHKIAYSSIIKGNGFNKAIYNYILKSTKLLDGANPQLGVRIYWVLNHLYDFPVCNKCKERLLEYNYLNFSIKNGYRKLCHKCAVEEKMIKMKENVKKKYGVENVSQIEEIKKKKIATLQSNYGPDITNPMQSDIIFNRYLSSIREKYNEPTITNIFQSKHAIKKIKETKFKHFGDENYYNVELQKRTLEAKYGKGIDNPSKIEAVKLKKIETCKKHFGVEYATQALEIISKSRKKYTYDRQTFDSKYEIVYYIWLKDNNINFVLHPNVSFKYLDSNGKTHYYFPDFIVEGKLVEIKGDHFFDKNGRLYDPYAKKYIPEKEKCILENNVFILKQSEMKMYVNYVKETRGKIFFDNLKKNHKQ